MTIDLHHGFGLPRPEDREKAERMSALRVSARFARLFRCQLDGKSDGEFRPGRLESWYVDICTVARFGRFVLLSEEESLFTLVISSGYRRSLVPVLERFHRRREELVRELGLSGIPPISFTTSRFGKMAQWENALACGLRNRLFRFTSAKTMTKQLDPILRFEG